MEIVKRLLRRGTAAVGAIDLAADARFVSGNRGLTGGERGTLTPSPSQARTLADLSVRSVDGAHRLAHTSSAV